MRMLQFWLIVIILMRMRHQEENEGIGLIRHSHRHTARPSTAIQNLVTGVYRCLGVMRTATPLTFRQMEGSDIWSKDIWRHLTSCNQVMTLLRVTLLVIMLDSCGMFRLQCGSGYSWTRLGHYGVGKHADVQMFTLHLKFCNSLCLFKYIIWSVHNSVLLLPLSLSLYIYIYIYIYSLSYISNISIILTGI